MFGRKKKEIDKLYERLWDKDEDIKAACKANERVRRMNRVYHAFILDRYGEDGIVECINQAIKEGRK